MTITAHHTCTDFDFLVGTWEVTHRRLRNPLSGEPEDWHTFEGTCAARTYLDGTVSIDEIAMPDQGSSGMSVRLFDPVAREWTIWFVSSRDGRVQPPVRGAWAGDGCRFYGDDEYDGRAVRATYEWSDLTETSARWEQAFSVDGGETWETNWVMEFTRTSAEPEGPGDAHLARVTSDFAFMNGTLDVHNRKLRERLVDCDEWFEFDHVQVGRTHLGGLVSVDENVSADWSGLTFRVYDVAAGEWAIYWVDSRTNGDLGVPVRGAFTDGVGTFLAGEEIGGRDVLVRFLWDVRDPALARWEQAFSVDGGETWETNWVSTHAQAG